MNILFFQVKSEIINILYNFSYNLKIQNKKIKRLINNKLLSKMDSSKLISLFLIGGTAIVGGLIYKYFSKSDILTGLKAEFQKNKNYLSKEIAMKLMLLGVKNGNIKFIQKYNDIISRRRDNINNSENYDESCQETINSQQECYDEELSQIINIFEGKFSMNELQEISGGLPPMQLSHIYYLYDIPYFEGKLPSVQKAIEVYKFYVEYIQKGLKEARVNINDNDIFAKKELYFKFFYLNLKINDIIYEKYKLNDQIVKYVLRVNNMFDDKEIKQLQNTIKNFDGILLSY